MKKSTQKRDGKSRGSSRAHKKMPKVKVRHTEKNITGRGGLLSVVRFIDTMGYGKRFEKVSTFQRGEGAVYTLFDAVFFSMIGYISGVSTLSGTALIWKDAVLQKISGYSRVPHETTLGRIFGKLKAPDIAEFEHFIHRMRQQVWTRSKTFTSLAQKLWIDADSTVSITCGHQEGAAKGYNPGKKGALSYHPLLAFATQTKEILQGWFRTGSAYTGNGIVGFMEQLLAQLEAGRKIVFRADSGFFSGALFDLLEERGHDYLVKVKLKNLASLLAVQSYREVEGHPGWEACVFEYRARGWSRARTFKALRHTKRIPLENALYASTEIVEYFCYATTLELTPWETHRCYGQRATSETWIEELKSQMKSARMQGFFANAAAFQSAILAYNTLKWMMLFTQDSFLKKLEVKSIRLFLIHRAAKLTTGGRTLTLNFNAVGLYPNQWKEWLRLGAP